MAVDHRRSMDEIRKMTDRQFEDVYGAERDKEGKLVEDQDTGQKREVLNDRAKAMFVNLMFALGMPVDKIEEAWQKRIENGR